MGTLSRQESGFTLIEVLVSVGIMLVFLPFAASMLTNSQLWASYSKHKLQAAYAAKQEFETLRQQAVLNGTITSQVILDTKGNFNNNADYFYGTETVTVSSATYTNSVGATSTNPNVSHVQISITWPEQILSQQVTMTENYAADIITNDTILN